MNEALSAKQSAPRPPITVNGTPIDRAAIASEAQHHPAGTPGEAMKRAAEALVLRELLVQEARRRGIAARPAVDEKGRRETEVDALIGTLVDSEVISPSPGDEEIARYYAANLARFRAPDLYEASHILIAARRDDKTAYEAARAKAEMVAAELAAVPTNFAGMAQAFSDCSSSRDGGSLGQVTAAETTPEFAAALARLNEGETTAEPVETPYGFHIIRLERHIAGKALPLTAVAERIADYLSERSQRTASAQFLARLVSAADISGIEIAGAEQHRVF